MKRVGVNETSNRGSPYAVDGFKRHPVRKTGEARGHLALLI